MVNRNSESLRLRDAAGRLLEIRGRDIILFLMIVAGFWFVTESQRAQTRMIDRQTTLLIKAAATLDTTMMHLSDHGGSMTTHNITASTSHEQLHRDIVLVVSGIEDLKRIVEMMVFGQRPPYRITPDDPQ